MKNLTLHIQPKLMLLAVTTAFALVTAVGCGGPTDGRITVSGTVTIDGAPLQEGTVTFYKGESASGVGIIEGGKFTVSQSGDTQGMEPGEYQVAIQSWEVEPFAVDEDGNIGGPGTSRIPEKYNSTSTSELFANVTVENSEQAFFLTTE